MASDLVNWTHVALQRLFDLPFLERHAHAPAVKGRFADGQALQGALLQAIRQLMPPVNVSSRSTSWRTYNVLDLRYIQGLTQPQVASQLSIGSRQIRREQQKGIQAVAQVLFEPSHHTGSDAQDTQSAAPLPDLDGVDMNAGMFQIDDVLRGALNLLEPLLQRQNLLVNVTAVGVLPVMRGSRMVARQLIVSAFNWLIHDVTNRALDVQVSGQERRILLRMTKPIAQVTEDELANVRQLANLIHASVHVIGPGRNDEPGTVTQQVLDTGPYTSLEIILPVHETVRVLMVDDNLDAVELVRRYLQLYPEYQLIAASRADEALKDVRTSYPACILLDVMMPDRDGWDMLTLLKAYPETASIPIIISSVLKEDELAFALGASAVLPKPFTAPQLLALLRSVQQSPNPAPPPQAPAGQSA
ncbi:MAG: response regulator [Chloroflexi bacterium]|nr:response regulator [Chloroflexota bacterium]MCL5275074.1 response regulator [Chloroflexota bacterium]